jgi:hypothetical protein
VQTQKSSGKSSLKSLRSHFGPRISFLKKLASYRGLEEKQKTKKKQKKRKKRAKKKNRKKQITPY